MDYENENYERFEFLVTEHLKAMWRNPYNLQVGVDISDIPEVKIIFDGFGYDEETDEQTNSNLESYAMFIHKDSGKDDFIFPAHETTPWCLIHRPKEEMCVHVWYTVDTNEWEIIPSEDSQLDDDDVLKTLEILHKKYFA